MKKLLIIQRDDSYFLFETLQLLETNHLFFKEYDLTVLADQEALDSVFDQMNPIIKGLTTDVSHVMGLHFDVSVNLSLKEESWDLHGKLNSDNKLGFYKKDGELVVNDLWSSYLLTLKARAPYLTFHLQDVYKNIIGIKGIQFKDHSRIQPKQIAFGTVASQLFPVQEQENFLNEVNAAYPTLPIKDISEIDLVEDVSATLYIGPANFGALKFAEAGGRCLFLTPQFQGFNFLPNRGLHVLLSSRGSVFRAGPLSRFLSHELAGTLDNECPYAVYTIDQTSSATAYLASHNSSDDNYPFYQSHVVLWSFLLNLSDVNLEVIKCSEGQLNLLKTQYEVLTKFIRLHDYAMSSIRTIHQEAQLSSATASIIDGHLRNLKDIEKISDQIAASHPLLRPVLDFYHIRRSQNFGNTLLEQAQSSLLAYAEEHQALEALQELFSVTLRKNEVNI